MINEAQILAVDDTPANLEVITEMLSSVGYTVVGAISGERALKRLRSYQPDLILLDIQMPDMDGFSVCQQIKAMPEFATVPIIFISALSDIGSMVRGFSVGAVDYISKPFQELEVLMRVKTHLQLHHLTDNLEAQVAARTQELEKALAQLQQSRLQLIQQEKMSAMGNLVAGVAHDINNPLGFLRGSTSNIKEYIGDLLTHLALYQQHYPDAIAAIQEHAEEIDLEFIVKDLPTLFTSMNEATARIASISKNLCNFARRDLNDKVLMDLHEGIDNTLQILKFRLKSQGERPPIDVVKDYGDVPMVMGFPGQINQVLMNLLANAIDAIDEGPSDAEAAPKITIKTITLADQNLIEIVISDNGAGMSDEVKAKAFEYLFTTKAIGQGTGLGLAIARQIIEENHGGHLTFKSTLGEGTEFRIQLPLQTD